MSHASRCIASRSAWRCALTLLLVTAGCAPASARAASPSAGWIVRQVSEPTVFSHADNAACEEDETGVPPNSTPCDSERIVVTNAGSMPSSGSVTISDVLSSGVTAVFVAGEVQQPGSHAEAFACTTSPIKCTYNKAVAPGGLLIVTVNVITVGEAPGMATSTPTVEGGGAATVSSSDSTRLNEANDTFGVNHFSQMAVGVDGSADTQAADHPYAFITSFNFNNTRLFDPAEHLYHHSSIQDPRELTVDLPPGLVADPQASARCPLMALDINNSETHCPAASEVGTVSIDEGDGGRFHTSSVTGSSTTPIYSLVPEAGYPAEFGFTYLGQPILMYGSLVRIGGAEGGYGLRVTTPGLLNITIDSVTVTFFGDPAQHDGGGTEPTAFFTNPTDCSATPLRATIESRSWEQTPSEPSVSLATTVYPQLTGCQLLSFEPTIALSPEISTADTPSGYAVEVGVPQYQNIYPVLATPELKDATVALPAGVSVSPSAANGLQGCSDAQIELASLSAGHCPPQSRVGTVKIVTPLLAEPLEGQVFVGEPECSPCGEEDAQDGRMLRLFLQAQGSGVLVKLEGRTSTNSASGGRLTTSFTNNPQLPFSELTLTLNGGPWAPLANPQSCGVFTTTSDMTPWSSPITADATPFTSLNIEGCANPQPFAPALAAGSERPNAGAFAPFNLTLARADREQDLSAIQVRTPPGLVGMLSRVQPCGEPQAEREECGPQSLIGHSEAAAGAGPQPYWDGGQVYLTGPYNGAPFGLSIVTHAQAGPFNLGNVRVRAAINVDPSTAAITVTSGPLPQILDGVPLRLKDIQVSIDREGFMLNPTNCRAQEVTGKIAAAQGAVANVASRFAVDGCSALPFKPVLTAAVQGQGSKVNGNRLDVQVKSPGLGQDDVAKVQLQFPKALSSRLETLQKACLQAVFEVNPAKCGEGSVIGTAIVHTPILSNPLIGPAYLVAHGGAEFPDVEFVLQGEGITLILDGKTDIKHGITYSRFETVPDAPFASFETILPAGPHSAFTANVAERKNHNLCGETLQMPTTITAQDGATLTMDTRIGIEGCRAGKTRKLTRAQALARALARCRHRDAHSPARRAACERSARRALRTGKAG
jgi:hypothetical protein